MIAPRRRLHPEPGIGWVIPPRKDRVAMLAREGRSTAEIARSESISSREVLAICDRAYRYGFLTFLEARAIGLDI